MHEWARHCLVELAAKGASLDELRDFCNENGIPGRRKKYWGTSTWFAALEPHRLFQYCGSGLYNVHKKDGQERPTGDWDTVPDAHPALITEDEAQQIALARRAAGKKHFTNGGSRTHKSNYLLSGGLFKCGRCGANMIGFKNEERVYYVCGSQPYRKGKGCGPGVYVPQAEIETEVLDGVRSVLGACGDSEGFTRKVNQELVRMWKGTTGLSTNIAEEVGTVDKKILNLRRAIENGLDDMAWANAASWRLSVSGSSRPPR